MSILHQMAAASILMYIVEDCDGVPVLPPDVAKLTPADPRDARAIRSAMQRMVTDLTSKCPDLKGLPVSDWPKISAKEGRFFTSNIKPKIAVCPTGLRQGQTCSVSCHYWGFGEGCKYEKVIQKNGSKVTF